MQKNSQTGAKKEGAIAQMANIMSWNIRGLNWPNKQEDVKIFLHSHHVGLVGLLETNIKEKNINSIAARTVPGWNWVHNFTHNT